MIERDFDFVLKEYFDTSNRKSMKTMLSLNEADQNQAMAALATKLYDKIVNKVDDIDYGTIPASKGDITQIGNFQEMRECMDVIRKILINYKQDTEQLDIIDKAIENIKDSKKIWERAFLTKCDLAITFYNTICLSIVSSISLLISSSIDFIKEPGNGTFTVSFDRVAYNKTKDKLLFQNLDKFNKSYLKGEIAKTMNEIVKASTNVKESTTLNESLSLAATVGGGLVIAALIVTIIPILHLLTNALYCARQSMSDYFEVQSKIIQFNAESLKYDYTKSEAEIEKIYQKQSKIAQMFKSISNKLSVKLNKADSDARKLSEKEKSEKVNANDLNTIDVPGMSSSIF